MKIFKTLFFVLLSFFGMFLAWSLGVTAGASEAIDDPEFGKGAKLAWDSLFPSSDKLKERRSKKKHEKYATLNEVLRGRDEFYEEEVE